MKSKSPPLLLVSLSSPAPYHVTSETVTVRPRTPGSAIRNLAFNHSKPPPP